MNKQQQNLISLALAALALLLSVWVIAANSSNRSLQKEYNEKVNEAVRNKTPEVQRGGLSQQVGQQIIRDMASVALQDKEIKDLLASHGLNVTVVPTPTPAPGASPAPAPKATPSPAPESAK